MRIGETIVQTLWVGALWTVGYLVAPALFEYLETPAEAGRIAGELFTIVTWLSMVCGALLLLAAGRSRHHRSGAGDGKEQPENWMRSTYTFLNRPGKLTCCSGGE